MTEQQENTLENIGKCAMQSIREMVAALECDYDRLQELRDERDSYDPSDDDDDLPTWEKQFPDEAEELKQLEEDAGECSDQEDARTRIEEDALSLEFRSGWTTDCSALEAEEYCLLLTTGGPAVRIIGEIANGEPHSARLEVQDWFTPWTEHITTGDDHKALMTYVGCFYMGD